jgi:uncharacterized protein YdhG (YjbR/CyaY superfamily)
MAGKRPTTVAEYIKAAPKIAQPHLRKLRTILKEVAPDAEETIKWGNPFFVEPRFLFAYSAHKAHISLAPSAAALKTFKKDLEGHQTTTNFLKLPYAEPFPEQLIRKIARHQLRTVKARKDDNFW